MDRTFLWLIIFGLQHISLEIIELKEAQEKGEVIDGLCQLAVITSDLKIAVWFSKDQTDLVSEILKKLKVPVILNAIESSKDQGLETRYASESVIVLNDVSVEFLLKGTLWNANTRFLILAKNFNKIQSDFTIFWKFKVINVFEIVETEKKIVVYGFLPYTKGHCDSEKYIIVDTYSPISGSFVNGGSALKDSTRIKNMNQCPVNITIVDVKPITIFRDECGCNESSSLQGIEGNLMHEIARKLNFKPTFVIALDGIGWGWIRPSPHGAVGEVYTGRSDFANGLLAPTVERYENLDISLPYNGRECITCGVPKGAGVSTPSWILILVSEFTPVTWMLIFFSFIVTFFIFFALNKYSKAKFFFMNSDIFLYEFSSCLGMPIKVPQYLSFKLSVITWIIFCFIVTVAYKSSISSKLTVPNEDPDINTFEELLRSPLQLTGYNNMFRLLDYNSSEPVIKKMVERFQVTEFDINYAVDVIAEERKIAYVRHTSTFLYYTLISPKARGNIHVMSDCILSYYPIIITKKHSPFSYRLNQLISRLTESGITKKWKSEYIYDVPPAPKPFLKLSNYHMYGVFSILCGGCLLGFFLFVIELVWFHCVNNI